MAFMLKILSVVSRAWLATGEDGRIDNMANGFWSNRS